MSMGETSPRTYGFSDQERKVLQFAEKDVAERLSLHDDAEIARLEAAIKDIDNNVVAANFNHEDKSEVLKNRNFFEELKRKRIEKELFAVSQTLTVV